MTHEYRPSHVPLWHDLMRTPAREFGPAPLRPSHGAVPPGLRGRLYRVGPARQVRGDQPSEHWFDGDGAMLLVDLRGSEPRTVYRYVRTRTFEREERAGKYLYPGLRTLPRGPAFWRRSVLRLKHAANTAVLARRDKTLALWEGSHPYALDPDSLATRGPDDLGFLSPLQPFPAHPKIDPETDELYGFCQNPAHPTVLQVFVTDADLRLKQKASIPFGRSTFVHDVVLAGPYLVFLLPPIFMNLAPAVLGLRPFFDCLSWRPEAGTEVWILDRRDLTISARFTMDPFFCWHFGSMSCGADGVIDFTVARFDDFPAMNRLFSQLPGGRPVERGASRARLHRIALDPKASRVLSFERLTDHYGEFPTVDPVSIGRRRADTFLALYAHREPEPWAFQDAIGRFDAKRGTMESFAVGDDAIVSEPLYAQDRDDPSVGWVVSLVYRGSTDTSEVHIHRADRIPEGPVCILPLPGRVPPTFHGTFLPA